MSDSNTGRFVWHDLMTTDPKAAAAFYADVVGWKTEPFKGSNDYTLFTGNQGGVGGVAILPESAKQMGAPPSWMAHVGVDNVDETAALAKKLGGNVYVPPQDIPGVGRFSIIADPQGVTISAFKAVEPMKLHDVTQPGEVCWNELLTSDHEAGFKFYSQLFGWQRLDEMDMGPMGKYLLYGKDKTQFGGMFTKPKDAPMPSMWFYYFAVADLDAATARAKAKGAKVINGPMEVPGGNRIVQFTDPQGAAFALHGK